MKFRTLRADEIDARVGTCNDKGFSLLLYKDARCDQNILDETVGSENWQRKHYEVKGNMFCSVGIYDVAKKEWIWKDDCGTESNTEKEKGEASDSFKRACFNWGIGRELYTSPFIYIKGHTDKNAKGQSVPTYKSFTVTALETTDGKISKLQIKGYENGSNDIIFEYGTSNGENAKSSSKAPQTTDTSVLDMTLEQARQYMTKSGKAFYELRDEQLQYIVEKGSAKSSQAASLILADRNGGDMRPLDEQDLPF